MGANPKKLPTMLVPPTPVDEGERLAALCNLCLLDTKPEESFDRVTRLAARALDVPIVLVSLVDETRQWFKSRFGLEATQTPREISFCGHVVYDRRPLVVPDALKDDRFAGNPLVSGPPYIRAYVGIPLFTLNEQPIGTLCAIDTKPRKFGPQELELLADHAQIVVEAVHAREQAVLAQKTLQAATERERLYRDTFELGFVGIVHTALSGQLIRANQRAKELLGYAQEQLVQRTFVHITHPDDVAKNMELFQQMVAGKIDHYRMEKRFLRSDSTFFWANLSVALRRTASGKPDYAIATIEDISDLKQQQEELKALQATLEREVRQQSQLLVDRAAAMQATYNKMLAAEQAQRDAQSRVQSLANSVPAMIGYWNKEIRCEFANETYREWFGRAPEEIIGLHMKSLMGDELFALNEPHVRGVLSGIAQHFERRLNKADGTLSYVDARYTPDIDPSGSVIGFYVLVSDITVLRVAQQELEATNARLSQESTTDFLTGLANRRVFAARSEQAAVRFREHGARYGLILLDMDDFKKINDTFGHDVGDVVLQAIGRILRQELRGSDDVAARLGGEELAILCFGDISQTSLRRVGERIRSQIAKESVAVASGLIHFTGSLGVAICGELDTDWKSIYGRADGALYRAKAGGKNRVVIEAG